MNKRKVTKPNEQIKLSFSGMPEGEFDIDGLMASLRMEYQALTVSAGALIVQAIMKAECEQLAGKPYARKTDIDRWGSERPKRHLHLSFAGWRIHRHEENGPAPLGDLPIGQPRRMGVADPAPAVLGQLALLATMPIQTIFQRLQLP